MRNKKVLTRWLPAIAACAVLPVAAVTAFAGGHHQVTAKTHLTGRPDSGSAGNPWANDTFKREATVTSLGNAPLQTDCAGLTGYVATTGPCYAYNASLKDAGTFTAVVGQLTPNQTLNPGGKFGRTVTGSMTGYGNFSEFYATTKPNGGPNHGVLKHWTTSSPADPSSTWPMMFFATGTVSPTNEATFGYVYTAHVKSAGLATTQRWADTWNNGAGGALVDGNITG